MKNRLILLIVFFLCLPPGLFAEEEHGREIYYILQKGFIKVEGQTNFFDFNGEVLKHEGQLVEEDGSYSGRLLLRFSQLKFNLPLVNKVLQEKDYLNTTVYPTITIDLTDFIPENKPTQVQANIELHGVRRSVKITTRFQYLPPVVKVIGEFSIAQSDFKVKPYRLGLMKIKDNLKIQFKVFFCEVYKENINHKISAKTVAKLAAEDQIQVLMEKGFFGCAEIKKQQGKR